jgi:hypothetical protein
LGGAQTAAMLITGLMWVRVWTRVRGSPSFKVPLQPSEVEVAPSPPLGPGTPIMTTQLSPRFRRELTRLAGWLLTGALFVAACRKTEPELPVLVVPMEEVAAAEAQPTAPVSYPPCGDMGLPDCPLAVWMDAGPNNFLHLNLMTPLAAALRRLATIEPSGYPEWDTWALAGAASAERDDRDGVKRACAGCHDQYRSRYRSEIRGRPVSISTGVPDAGADPPSPDDPPAPTRTRPRRSERGAAGDEP